ncbi:MAG: hypothetical protein GF416_06085 [Candidatus Altiarchaeales archaeon]|nr:hypothetical protein [Candidatus Altiarchaeales archaeon]MBD3416685.1 hypothetical protein [Candidatus Altiarchaeales archaeon]
MAAKKAKKAKKSRKKAKKKAKKKTAGKSKKAPENPVSDGETPLESKSSEIRLKKKQLKKQLLALEVEEKKVQAKSFADEASTWARSSVDEIKHSDPYRRLSRMPEPLKYSLIFIFLLLVTVFGGMFLISIVLALTHSQPEAVVVESNSTIEESQMIETSTTVSTTSTTSTSTTSTTDSTTTLPQIVCAPPYMRFGLGCCLDLNNNTICDQDEADESTTTTLADYIRCNDDGDCGSIRTEYECRENDLFRVTISHFCKNPETRASSCETNVVEELVEPCGPMQQCFISRDGEGKCQNKYTRNNFIE